MSKWNTYWRIFRLHSVVAAKQNGYLILRRQTGRFQAYLNMTFGDLL